MRGVTAGRPTVCLGVALTVAGLTAACGPPSQAPSKDPGVAVAGDRPEGHADVIDNATATDLAPDTPITPRTPARSVRATESVPRDPVLVGAGDIGSCTLRKAAATAALIAATPGTVFTAGDNAYERGTADEFRQCYDPSWGQFRDRTRPTPGNHDYETPEAAGYFDYFGSQAGSPRRPWYAYNLGAWRIYALNSNCQAIGGCDRGSHQQRWLAADLRRHPAPCVAAIWHHPLFSSGAHGNDPITRDLWRTLQAAGADLVLSGHDHDYERFARQDAKGRLDRDGIREFVVGTGGAERRRLGAVQPHSQALKAGIFGVLKLTLRPRGYAWEYLAAAGSTFEDHGRAACH